MHLSRFAAALLPVLLAVPVYAQSCAQVDGKLAAHYQEMIDNGSYAGNAADDASGRRDKAAAAFQAALGAYLKDASSWQCKFPQTVGKNGLRIVESSDSKLRTYSWDEQGGGSMHNHTTLAQWRAPSGAIRVKTLSTGEAAPFVSDLIADNFGHYGKGYIVIGYGIGSSRAHSQDLTIYRLGERNLQPLNIIRTAKLTNTLGYGFDVSTVQKSGLADIAYDRSSKTISLPVVVDDGEGFGTVKKARIRYRFNGRYFVKTK